MKKLILLALAATALSAPIIADNHKEMSKAEHDTMHKAHQSRLAGILADPSRVEDSKRDKYRNPAKTFDFFRLHPDHKIGEYAPGGEWISRIVGKYVNDKGKFTGLYFSTNAGFGTPEAHTRIKASAAKFGEDVAKVTGRPATDL